MMEVCANVNSRGKRCKNPTKKGSVLCHYHLRASGLAPASDLIPQYSQHPPVGGEDGTLDRLSKFFWVTVGALLLSALVAIPVLFYVVDPVPTGAKSDRNFSVAQPAFKLDHGERSSELPQTGFSNPESSKSMDSPNPPDVAKNSAIQSTPEVPKSSSLPSVPPAQNLHETDQFVSVAGRLWAGTELYNKYTHQPFGIAYPAGWGEVDVLLVNSFEISHGKGSIALQRFARSYITENFVTKKKK